MISSTLAGAVAVLYVHQSTLAPFGSIAEEISPLKDAGTVPLPRTVALNLKSPYYGLGYRVYFPPVDNALTRSKSDWSTLPSPVMSWPAFTAS